MVTPRWVRQQRHTHNTPTGYCARCARLRRALSKDLAARREQALQAAQGAPVRLMQAIAANSDGGYATMDRAMNDPAYDAEPGPGDGPLCEHETQNCPTFTLTVAPPL